MSLGYAGSSVKLGEPDPRRRLVLVLVESRLLRPPRFTLPGARPPALLSRMNRLVADIRRDGDDCRLVSADLYQGPVQKDGRVLLALRRFLQRARDRVGLTSVVMIGRFPEAQILRRWPWAPAFEKTIAGVATDGRRYLAVDPELVAGSTDIVLADLTGRWEEVYRPSVTTRALYLLPTGASSSADWLRLNDEISGTVVDLEPETTTTDVFYLDEARLEMNLTGPVARVRIRRFRDDPEVTTANQARPNPIAFPEITVSRLNAYHVAVRLPADRSPATGTTGRVRPAASPTPQANRCIELQRGYGDNSTTSDGGVRWPGSGNVHQHSELRHRTHRRPGGVGDPSRRVHPGPGPVRSQHFR